MGKPGELEGFRIMKSARFRVSLHVTHPAYTSEDIAEKIGAAPELCQTVGAPRQTKSGKHLGGTYRATNISFSLHNDPVDTNNQSPGDVIAGFIKSFDTVFFEDFYRSGGVATFVIGIYCENTLNINISSELMTSLGNLHISLDIVFYGGPGK